MLDETKTPERIDRHHITQEDFTPDEIVESMCAKFPEDIYTDFSKTVLDPCCGIGNLLLYVIERRLKNCNSVEDIYSALSSVYGTELMPDNVAECKTRIINAVRTRCRESVFFISLTRLNDILNHNIVCTDTFNWNYELWCSYNTSLF